MSATTKCRSCGAPIVWIPTPSGKSMPCDAKAIIYHLNPTGPLRLVTASGNVVSCEEATDNNGDGVGYVPHWNTCNTPAKFRKGR